MTDKSLKELLDDLRCKYKVHKFYYKDKRKTKIELDKLNSKGFYNCVKILENDRQETIDNAILEDYFSNKRG